MSVFKYPECRNCVFCDREPTICEQCENANEFEDDGFGNEMINYFFEDREIE